jgi:hypothetical protein
MGTLAGFNGGYVFNGKKEKSFTNGGGTDNNECCAVVVAISMKRRFT